MRRFLTTQMAVAAITRLRVQPGFRDYPDGFEIVVHELDHDEWTEGFGFGSHERAP
jgi:hypothetical protein